MRLPPVDRGEMGAAGFTSTARSPAPRSWSPRTGPSQAAQVFTAVQRKGLLQSPLLGCDVVICGSIKITLYLAETTLQPKLALLGSVLRKMFYSDSLGGWGRQNNACLPLTPMSWSLEPVSLTLCGKRDFAHKLRIFKWGESSGISSGSGAITWVLMRGRQWGESQRGGCADRSRDWIVYFEDGGRGHGLRNSGGLQQLQEARKQILPSSRQKERSPVTLWF